MQRMRVAAGTLAAGAGGRHKGQRGLGVVVPLARSLSLPKAPQLLLIWGMRITFYRGLS